jgi:hypothetical protein
VNERDRREALKQFVVRYRPLDARVMGRRVPEEAEQALAQIRKAALLISFCRSAARVDTDPWHPTLARGECRVYECSAVSLHAGKCAKTIADALGCLELCVERVALK